MITAVCCHCHQKTEAPVVVRYVERVSGPGWTLHACPDCAPKLLPGPLPGETVTPQRD